MLHRNISVYQQALSALRASHYDCSVAPLVNLRFLSRGGTSAALNKLHGVRLVLKELSEHLEGSHPRHAAA